MNREEKIKELQLKIYDLSADINSSLHQLRKLQADLDGLRLETDDSGGNQVGFPAKSSAIPPSPSKPIGIENFIGLRLMHLAGIVMLVTGISIGVKFAIDQQLISEAMRVLLAYGAGIVLFILSVRLKKKYQLFSAILFSGSMASIYFTTYAAFVYYQFLPVIIAFLIMVAITAYTVFTALSYDRKEIAIIGMIGAYGIPFLISANSERADLFFSYILLINIGVVFLSFKKGWKLMSQLALLITWILFIGWSLLRYDPSQQWVAVVFMTVYFILFLISALAFRISRNAGLTYGEIQQVIINNTAFYIASLIVFGYGSKENVLPVTTLFLFLLTSSLAFISSKIFSSEILLQRLLSWQSLLFLLIFIAVQWDGIIVTLLWVAVSVLLFGWGIFTQKSWARLASALLIGITLVKLLVFDSEKFSAIQKITCYIILGVLLLIFSFYYQKLRVSHKKEHR